MLRECRHVAAFGNLDQNRIGQARGQVVPLQRAAQMSGLDTDDRIVLRIEGGVAPENLDGDGIGLYAAAAARQRFFDDMAGASPSSSSVADAEGEEDEPTLGSSSSSSCANAGAP